MRADTEEAHTHRHTRASHIIRSTFEPSGFYCARLENGAIKPMGEPSAPLLPTTLALLLLLQIRTLMHIGQHHGLPPMNIARAQIKRVKTTILGLLTAHSAPEYLGVSAPHIQ